MFRMMVGIAAVLVTTATAQAQCPRQGSASEQVNLNEGFLPDPNRHHVTAGGDLDIGRCSNVPGTGFVAELPDFRVNYRTERGQRSSNTLTFYVQSSADTVLLIHDPSGRWHFNDDGDDGHNPKVSFPRAMAGRYEVWVGTFEKANRLPAATLLITEIEGTDDQPGESANRGKGGGGGQQARGACGWYAVFQCARNSNLSGPGHTIRTDDFPNFRAGYFCRVQGPFNNAGEARQRAHAGGGYAKSGC
jgi:hypothetical protein